MGLERARECVRERVAGLPNAVWDCERCGSAGTMAVRRSSLNTPFKADDVTLKCEHCRRVVTHGIPFEDPGQFARELDTHRNGSRVLDFAREGPAESVSENLAALGYTAAAELED